MGSVGDISNDDEIFVDVVDTPKDNIKQHKKWENLKSIIDKGKLGQKWTQKRVHKSSDEIINKTYAEHRQRELNEKTGKALGKHVINLYSTDISRWFKIKDGRKLLRIENDTIIKDQMAGLACHFVCTFGNYIAPILIAVHTANNLDLGNEPENKNKGYESN